MAPSRVHLFKKSAIEAGTPNNYYLNPSNNLMKMASEWKVVEREDFITVKLHLFGFADLVFAAVEGNFIEIDVVIENKEKAARFVHKDGMKSFKIEMNPRFLKLSRLNMAYGVQEYKGKVWLHIPKLQVSGFLMAPKIHLFKKSAVEAGVRGNYYLKPSEKLLKMTSEWTAVEYEDFVIVTINHDGFGDQVFCYGKEGHIHIEVAKENKEKAARFGIKDGMKDLKIKLNHKFLNLIHFFIISEGKSETYIPKLRLKFGERNPNYVIRFV